MSLKRDIKKLDEAIEDLDLSEMTPGQMDDEVRTIKGNSAEARQIRAQRKKIRYQLYRLRTEALGKGSAQDVLEAGVKEHFESQPCFRGWRFFAELWDVALMEPMTAVSRDMSEADEWDAVIRSKYPQILPGGKLVYPDLSVKRAVEAEAKKRGKQSDI